MNVERIEVFVTELPVRVQRIFSSGSWDTGPQGQVLGKPVLVRLYAGGVVGLGQIRPISPGHFIADTTQGMVAAITQVYGPLLLGRSIFDLEGIHESFDQRLAGNSCARAALDIALHDAMGKALQLPVHQLIGGCCQQRIPLEWSVSLAEDVGRMVADASRAVHEFGIKVLCLKAADRRGWRQDVRHFEAVRREVGDDVVIGVDPNTGWTVADTLAAMRELRHFDLGYVEQPVARDDMRGLAAVRRAAEGVPIMADESLFTVQDAWALAKAEAVDAYCIKLYKVGGLSNARKIAAVAEAAHVQLNVGGLAVQSQLDAAAAVHFYASVPARRMLGAGEFLFGLNATAPDPLVAQTDFVVRDGHVDVPIGPGLGITLDEDLLARHTLLRETVA